MGNVFKVRLKQASGNVPKGYELQVVSKNTSLTTEDVKNALIAAGFKPYGAGIFYEKI